MEKCGVYVGSASRVPELKPGCSYVFGLPSGRSSKKSDNHPRVVYYYLLNASPIAGGSEFAKVTAKASPGSGLPRPRRP